MTYATFAEYQAAKNEIIGGVEFKEEMQSPNQNGMMSKQYSTMDNGTFYEVTDPNTGIMEFWSDKHSESRYYNANAPQAQAEKLPAYGNMLAEKIRATTENFSKLTHFENFVLNCGWKFRTEEALKAGYDRAWKCSRDILITQDEFVAEAGKHYEAEPVKEAYNVLADLVSQKKLQASDVYSYAHFCWCLRNPRAIVAHQEGRDKWLVNNCDTEISEDEAIVAVNSEWGFEASRVKIIGTPYYDATDYQFIRFDCAHMTWLWKNGNLYQVYAD